MTRSYRSTWKQNVSERQAEIMLGSLLGDATMWKTRNENQVFYFSTTTVERDYAEWKYSELANLCTRTILVRERERRGTPTVAYEVNTASHPIFREWRSTWYPQGKKVVPENVAEWLTPLALAVWFMDDGYRFPDTVHQMMGYKKRYTGRTISFSTDAFSNHDKALLIGTLVRRYKVYAYLVDNRKQLRFEPRDSQKLVNIMRPFIQPCFNYKIAIDAPDEIIRTRPSQAQ